MSVFKCDKNTLAVFNFFLDFTAHTTLILNFYVDELDEMVRFLSRTKNSCSIRFKTPVLSGIKH